MLTNAFYNRVFLPVFSRKKSYTIFKFLDKLITSESCESALLPTTEMEDIECRKTTLNEKTIAIKSTCAQQRHISRAIRTLRCEPTNRHQNL